MPELPEVETVRKGLAPVLEGSTIKLAKARRKNLRYDIPQDFSDRLEGNKVRALKRRSKYILMECEDGLVSILHLGMSGRFNIHAAGTAPELEKHDHIYIETMTGDRVVYNDPRRFGFWLFSDVNSIDEHDHIKNIGPEPLGNSFSEDTLLNAFHNKKTNIKAALLDQRIVAGLGNIYVCEVLWRTGVHPETAAKDISKKQIETIVPTIRTVLSEAIEAGGSTLKDYAQVDGELGYFQHSFKAYGREGEACLKEGCGGTVERIVQSNRSTFFCPKCQR